ncbi:UNVERIFIED_CONTAM: hypothetical protein HDU68_001651 [Siphonaria sp. JEL0065]|nr:hypothetical protein HDU68_001651 [Siphonaria sp. JEL0065]
MAANNHPWKAIEQLPSSFAEDLAYQIQAWRKDNNGISAETLKNRFTVKITDSKVIACEKLDGTNVGIDMTGRLFGRRFEIDPVATSYQKTPLTAVFAVRDKIKNLHSKLADGLPEPSVFRAYGELSCNPHLYNYLKAGLNHTWECFGILMYFKSFDDEAVWREVLVNAGFWIRTARCIPTENDDQESRKPCITMSACPQLFSLLDEFGISHPSIFFQGTLEELVKENAAWMMAHTAEGLVLSIKFCYEGSESTTARKWKQSHEPQEGGIGKLQELLNDPDKALFLSDEMKKFLITLLDVSTHPGKPVHNRKPPTIKEPKTVKPAKNFDVYNSIIKSAVSKYDTDEVYFQNGKKGEYIELLLKEVVEDYPQYSEGAKCNLTDATAAVNRHVGMSYGQWMKSNKK